MQTAMIVTPKSFFVQERDRFYDNWIQAFWREMFQNSNDAGAKVIRITLETAAGKGSFGREAAVDEVIRVVFEDDGCGMTQEIIDDVYFRPGETTKKDGKSTGGYGRARLMSNFSQVRFAIHTGHRVVEGDGPEYRHESFLDMAEAYATQAAALEQELAGSPADESLQKRIRSLRQDEAQLREMATQPPVKGCRIEIDINPEEYGPGSWRNPNMDKLQLALTNYLQMSQLPGKIFVNGEERKERLMRGPAKRHLEATLEDGTVRRWGTLHTSKSDKASHKKQLIVRVDGATMFATSIEVDLQVILELDKETARDVMTSNRDGFREPYQSVYEKMKSQLILDVRSALDDADRKNYTVDGSLGKIEARRPVEQIKLDANSGFHRYGEVNPIKPVLSGSTAKSQLERYGYAGVPYGLLEKFVDQAKYDNSFLSAYGKGQLREKLRDATSGRYGVEMVRSALEALDDEQKEFVLGHLLALLAEQEEKARAETERKLKGLPDIRIHTHGNITGKLRDAMRRNDPTKWDPEKGRGQRARSILAAWTICVDEAIKTVMKHHPEALPESFSWAPGFIYSVPQQEYRLGKSFESHVREAEHAREAGTENHYLLINPVDSDGNLKINPRDPRDLQYMAMLSAHEVAHIHERYHNEDFASLMTAIAARMDMREVSKRTNAALAEIREIYAKGKARYQAMDNQPGPRPAERLLAEAVPGVAVTAGIMSASENRHLDSGIRHGFVSSITPSDDGSVEVDCDSLQAMEQGIAAQARPSEELVDAPEPTYGC